MININKAKKEFILYTKDIKGIEMKLEHSLRVMEISKKIAEGLELQEEQIEIATLIGLLHDIGKINQYENYKSNGYFKKFEHGDYGAYILDSDIRKYIETDKYDNIIKKSVKNHSKFQIEEGLTEEEILFSKIIRDADKIDIFYECICIFWNGIEDRIENETIPDNVLDQFRKHVVIKRRDDSYQEIESIIRILSFIFDINFKTSFEILKKEDYINKIINRFNFNDENTQEKMEEIKKIANKYIEEKVKGL